MIVCFLKPKAKKKIEAYGFKKETEQAVAPIGTLTGQESGGVVLGGAAVLGTVPFDVVGVLSSGWIRRTALKGRLLNPNHSHPSPPTPPKSAVRSYAEGLGNCAMRDILNHMIRRSKVFQMGREEAWFYF